MSRPLLLAATLLAISTGPVCGEPIPAQEISGLVDWVYDYEKGRALARKTGKPMFVVFRCER